VVNRRLDRPVAAARDVRARLLDQRDALGGPQDLARAVRGTAVDDDDLVRGARLRGDGVEPRTDVPARVLDRRDEGDLRGGAHRAPGLSETSSVRRAVS